MISVRSKNKNSQKLLSQFKSLVNNEKIIETYKAKRYYLKPSLRKKLKREAAERQRAKDYIDEIKELMKNRDDVI